MNGGTSALKRRGCCCSDREVAIPAISSGSSGKADMKGGGVEQLKDGTPPQNIRSHGGLTDETGVVSLSKEETDVPRWWRLRDKIQELNLKPN